MVEPERTDPVQDTKVPMGIDEAHRHGEALAAALDRILQAPRPTDHLTAAIPKTLEIADTGRLTAARAPSSSGSETRLELDLRTPPEEIPAPRRRRLAGRFALGAALVAVVPAWGTWSVETDAEVLPLERELSAVLADPGSVRDGTARPPREIEPDIARASARALTAAGLVWVGSATAGLWIMGWMAGRRPHSRPAT